MLRLRDNMLRLRECFRYMESSTRCFLYKENWHALGNVRVIQGTTMILSLFLLFWTKFLMFYINNFFIIRIWHMMRVMNWRIKLYKSPVYITFWSKFVFSSTRKNFFHRTYIHAISWKANRFCLESHLILSQPTMFMCVKLIHPHLNPWS